MKKEAFTLIELLVVIAVISILMAILVPALRKARDQGRRIVCTSNVRTLVTAWYMYQGDNDSKLVNGNVPRSEDFEKPPEGAGLLGRTTAERRRSIQRRLRPYP